MITISSLRKDIACNSLKIIIWEMKTREMISRYDLTMYLPRIKGNYKIKRDHRYRRSKFD